MNPYRGWSKSGEKYASVIGVNDKRVYGGLYNSIEEAALAFGCNVI